MTPYEEVKLAKALSVLADAITNFNERITELEKRLNLHISNHYSQPR